MDYIPDEEALQDEERRLSLESGRAATAAQVLENEVFKDACDAVKDRAWQAFSTSGLNDDGARYHARVTLMVLDEIIKGIREHMTTGQMAEIQKQGIERMRRTRDAEPGGATWQ